MQPDKQEQYLNLARQAARQAGEIQMASFGKDFEINTKSSGSDLVTSVDLACDELIRDLIGQQCPDDILLTEETFDETGNIDLSRTWVIDPLDGTTNYSHSFPHFAVSIAYFEDGLVQLGVIHDPFKQETFTARRGHGAYVSNPFVSEQPLQVSQADNLERALLATGFPYDVKRSPENNLNYFCQITRLSHGVRRPGAAALDLAYLACGRIDGFWELKLAPWDIAAGSLMVEEAGGKITDFHGQPMNYTAKKPHIVGSNGKASIHEALVDILSREPDAKQQTEEPARC